MTRFRFFTIAAGAALLVLVSAPQAPRAEERPRLPIARDWSHRHMVFSQPASMIHALRLQQDPRFLQQWAQRGRGERRDLRWYREPHAELHRDWSMSMGAGATVGAGQYPAKYSFDATTASCSTDFVVYNTGLAASTTQASIIAYSNLYTGCGGTVPGTFWAFNTGGTITTSVSLSGDGSQVMFVQTQAGVATLVLLKWKSSTTETASAPLNITNASTTGPGTVSNANYRSCIAPCMTTITLNGSPTDTYSSPFYDFTPGSDAAYVGDDTGHVHKFTGVFSGTPAEAGSPWPVLAASVKLSSPIYDSATGNIFVATTYQHSNNSGARLQAICATATCAGLNNGSVTTAIGTTTPTNVLGPTQTSAAACHGTGASGNGSDLRLDAPIVDSAAGKLYVFVGNDGNGNSAVMQFSTTVDSTHFSFHSCGTEATIGTGSTTGVPLFSGAFDNVYFTSASGANPSGNLYVCGNTSGNATLYQVRVTSNAIAATGTAVLALSSASTTCSPVTEVDSGGTDRAFVSVQANGATGAVNCPAGGGGCVMSFNLPLTISGALPTGSAATLAAAGGTSGIVIDDIVAPGTLHTSQVYYSTMTSGAAVQASQAGLN